MQVYASCIDGYEAAAKKRIEAALDAGDPSEADKTRTVIGQGRPLNAGTDRPPPDKSKHAPDLRSRWSGACSPCVAGAGFEPA
jgi:hypothetical protein